MWEWLGALSSQQLKRTSHLTCFKILGCFNFIKFSLVFKAGKREKLDNPEVDFQKLENSRRLLLEGIRHHKDSPELYREYLCLELHFIEKLHQKEEKVGASESGESEDKIRDGKIAKIVLKQAFEDIPDDPRFESELVAIMFHFPIAKVRTKLLDYYLEFRESNVTSWDTLARVQLIDRMVDDGRNVADKLENCINVYQRGVDKVPASDLFDRYLSTLMEVCRSVAKDESEKSFMAAKVMDAFVLGEKLDVLSEKQRQMQKHLLDGCSIE